MQKRFAPALLVALLAAACGGGDGPADTTASLRGPARAAAALTPGEVLDWAEGAYADLFPGHAENQSYLQYVYRFYPATGNYLGLAGEDVYVMGPVGGNQLLRVGALSDFRCSIAPASCGPAVSGVAAAAAPVGVARVTIRDASGHSVSVSTDHSGRFSAPTQGFTGPLLLQVTTAGGTRLYGVTGDTNSVTTANISPLTDLVVRSWYAVQGTDADTAFASLAAHPAPDAVQVQAIGQQFTSVLQLAARAYGASLTSGTDLVNKPSSSGLLSLLAHTQVQSPGNQPVITVNLPGATQTVSVSYDPGASTMTLNSSTVAPSGTTAATRTTVVPVTAAQSAAIQQVVDRVNALGATIVSRGMALTVADLEPFIAADALEGGLNRSQMAAGMVNTVRGAQSFTGRLVRIRSIDLAGGIIGVNMRLQASANGQTMGDTVQLRLRRDGDTWVQIGDGRIAGVEVNSEARRNQWTGAPASGTTVNVGVGAPSGTVLGVTATSSVATLQMSRGSGLTDDSGILLDTFYGNSGTLGSLPPAGSSVTVSLSKAGGGTVNYTERMNAVTSELISLTSPTGSSLASANLGGRLAVGWTLPTTYVVDKTEVSITVFTGDPGQPGTQQCDQWQEAAPTATSTMVDVPASCNGAPVRNVTLSVRTEGQNGERSSVLYVMR